MKSIAKVQGTAKSDDDEDSGSSWFGSLWGSSSKKEENTKAKSQGANDPSVNPGKLHPSYPLFRRFIDGSLDSEIKGRMKAITRICNLEDCDFNPLMLPLARQFNGVPYLLKECTDYRKKKNIFQVSIDVHLFTLLAKQGLMACKESLTKMSYDVCMVIEGVTDDELPERMVLGCRINLMDLANALKLKVE